jgi:hypothetical protein
LVGDISDELSKGTCGCRTYIAEGDVVGARPDGNAIIAILNVIVLNKQIGSTGSKPIGIERERL